MVNKSLVDSWRNITISLTIWVLSANAWFRLLPSSTASWLSFICLGQPMTLSLSESKMRKMMRIIFQRLWVVHSSPGNLFNCWLRR
jgi:hypothetical protein